MKRTKGFFVAPAVLWLVCIATAVGGATGALPKGKVASVESLPTAAAYSIPATTVQKDSGYKAASSVGNSNSDIPTPPSGS